MWIWLLNTFAALFVLGASLLSALAAEAHGDEAYNLGYRTGSFAGTLFIIVIISYLVSIFAKGTTRAVIRGGAMMGLSSVMAVGALIRVGEAVNAQRALADAKRMGDQARADAKKAIAENGDYTPNADQARQNIEKLQGELTGDSETARAGRDLLNVSSEIVTKVQASQDIENKGDFTLAAIKTPDDLAAQTAQLTKLRAAQADMVDYLENFDQHCRDAMAADHFPDAFIAGAIHGARTSGHIELVTTLWKTKVKLTDDFLARQDLLKKDWGQWQVQGEKVLFTDDDSIAAYNGIMTAIRDDAAEVKQVQTQIFQ